MKRLQHEAIAAQHHDRIGFLDRHPISCLSNNFKGLLREACVRRSEGKRRERVPLA